MYINELTCNDKCKDKHELCIPKLSAEFHSPFSPEIIGVEKHKCNIKDTHIRI